MKQLVKHVVKPTVIGMCISGVVAIVPSATFADGPNVNININIQTGEQQPDPVTGSPYSLQLSASQQFKRIGDLGLTFKSDVDTLTRFGQKYPFTITFQDVENHKKMRVAMKLNGTIPTSNDIYVVFYETLQSPTAEQHLTYEVDVAAGGTGTSIGPRYISVLSHINPPTGTYRDNISLNINELSSYIIDEENASSENAFGLATELSQ